MQYVLEKLTNPGFVVRADNPESIHWMLEQKVCSGCKMTHTEVLAEMPKDTSKWELKEVDLYSLPDNYHQLTASEKIDALLGTRCGSGFIVYVS